MLTGMKHRLYLVAATLLASCSETTSPSTTRDTSVATDMTAVVDVTPEAATDVASDTMIRGACANPVNPFPAAIAPRCAPSTLGCVARCLGMGATTVACETECVRADTTPSVTVPTANGPFVAGCSQCIYITSLSCMERAGCRTQVADYLCCLSDRCAGSTDPMCGPSMCAEPIRAMAACSPPTCFNYAGAEFRFCYAVPTDGGTRNDASTD
jgi:hypothetical protein